MNTSVPSNAVHAGALVELGICPTHGEPATKTRSREFVTRTPGWVYLLIPFGLLVAALVQMALQKKVKGPVPECPQCRSRRRTYNLLLAALWIGALAALIATGVTSNGALAVLWLVLQIAAIVWVFQGGRFMLKGTLSKDQIWVELRRVDERFVQAVQARMAATAQPPAVPADGLTPLS